MDKKMLWSGGLALAWLGFAVLPGYVFFSLNSLTLTEAADFKTLILYLQPLVGLYAFFGIWAQIIIGSQLSWLRPRISWIWSFHKSQGVTAFILALLHPVFLALGVGFDNFFRFQYVPTGMVRFAVLGYAALFLLMVTVLTALFMKLPWLRTRWRALHYLNYAVFFLVWIHAWYLGSDVQAPPLRRLWVVFLITAVAAIGLRVFRAFHPPRAMTQPAATAPPVTKQPVKTQSPLEPSR